MEVENIIDELKTHLLDPYTDVRSQNREVVQEIYGWLLGHWSVRVSPSCQQQVQSLSLSFARHATSIRRAIPKFQYLQPEEFPFFLIG